MTRSRSTPDERDSDQQQREFYPTPAWAVVQLMREVGAGRFGRATPAPTWHEPAVGNGAIVAAVEWFFEQQSDPGLDRPRAWTTCDVRDVADDIIDLDGVVEKNVYADYLFGGTEDVRGCPDLTQAEDFDVAITNPPFSLAVAFAQQMLLRAREVWLLQRNDWISGGARAGRNAWLRANKPDMFALGNRPSFVGGASDASEYAWYRWRRGIPGGRLFVLESMSLQERRRIDAEVYRDRQAGHWSQRYRPPHENAGQRDDRRPKFGSSAGRCQGGRGSADGVDRSRRQLCFLDGDPRNYGA